MGTTNGIHNDALIEQADYLIAQFKYVAELTGELQISMRRSGVELNARSNTVIHRMMLASERLNESAIDELEACLAHGQEANFRDQIGEVLHSLADHLGKVSMGCQSLIRNHDPDDTVVLQCTRRLLRFCRGLAERMRLYGTELGRRISHSQTQWNLTDQPSLPSSDDEPLHVAIVDDDPVIVETISEHLTQSHGFTVESFRAGESLLRRMAECTFDAVLLDVVLPGINGDEVLQSILNDPKLSTTPVLMMSGIMDPELVLGCLKRGAIDYLSKPIEMQVLDARIQACRIRKRLREMEYRQHFASDLSAELYCDPEKLDERVATISVLFCDIRRFSAITETLSTTHVVSWIRDVLTELSKCVFDHQGTLVDYAGDGLMAMWGAPIADNEHASNALNAAFQMQSVVASLAPKWEPILGEAMRVGIGINSGQAHVGVIGRFPKFKYGPLGPNVNIAARVEGITKYFHVPLLVTGQTHAFLKTRSDCTHRRVCDAELVNIAAPVPIYEYREHQEHESAALFSKYQSALAHFELPKLDAAAETLGTLFAKHPDDGPTRMLLARTLEAMVSGDHRPAWRAPGK